MAITATPSFVQTPIVGVALVATAVTSRAKKSTPFTNFVELVPTSTNGKRINAITVKGAADTAAGYVFIWIYDGTDCYLFDEIAVSAATTSATVASFQTTKIYDTSSNPPFNLQPTYKLYATTTITQNVNVIAFGFDY